MTSSFHNGEITILATCPSCAYPTLGRRAYYDICAICGWEDDGQDDREFATDLNHFLPDEVAGGPNHSYSLTEARYNFAKYHQMYRRMDTRSFERTNEDRSLREALIAIYSELLPDVNEKHFIAALPRIYAAFRSIYKALSERVRRYETQIHKEREKRYRHAFDILADRLATSWKTTHKYFEVTMEANGRRIAVTACTVFPHFQAHGTFRDFLSKTIERELEQSSFHGSEFDRWLVISDDSEPPLLDAYREAYRQLPNTPFQKVFVALPDGSVEDVSV